nr:reverse transcriptase domain-containing protein [Tanacetum cinerariifolium]
KKSQNQAHATVKAVEESCVTCGGAHSKRNYPATDGNIHRDNIQEFVSQASAVNYNQGNTSYRPSMMSNQIRPPGFSSVPNNQNVQLNQRNNQNRFDQNQNRGNNFNHGPVCQPPVFQPLAYQAPVYQASAPQTQGVLKEDFSAYVKANDTVMRNIQTQGQNMQNQLTNLIELFIKFVNSNSASTSSSCTLPCNTIANPRSDLKAITTRSVHPTNNESTEDVQPPVFQPKSPILTFKPVNSPMIDPVASPISSPRTNQRPTIPYLVRLQDQKLRDKANDQREKFFQIFKDLNFNISFADAFILMPKFGLSIKSLLTNKDKLCTFLFPADFVVVDFDADPRVPLFLRRSFLKTGRALIDVFEGELTLRVGKEAITFNLDQTSRYSTNYNVKTTKRIDVIDMASEEYSQEVLGFSDVITSGNPTSYYDPIVSTTSPTLTPFGNSDFLLEEVVHFLLSKMILLHQKLISLISTFEGDVLLLEAFMHDDPSLRPPDQGNYLPEVRKELKICKAKSNKSSIDEPPEVELKHLPPYLEYALLEGDDKLPVSLGNDLIVEEKTALITVLKSHKRAIAWKLFDIKGIEPEFCTHKILMEEDFEPAVQHQRRVNHKIHNVIEQEGGFTVVENEENELILTRLVTGWRVCIDYRKLNEATRKDHFSLSFMDQMLERLARNQYYCFLDGFSGYFQIPIDPKDLEKTTFTCPYRTFAYRRMPFGLCNTPGTFQRCMMAIFHDMIEKTIEMFMEDFLVFGNSFQSCLSF